jgi:cyclopropane fatty-acyl-phospholipid synthase-like methyltransferase
MCSSRKMTPIMTTLNPKDLIKFEIIRHCLPVWRKYNDPKLPGYDAWSKYFTDFDYAFERHWKNYMDLKLDLVAGRHILDIGAGAGYFAYICSKKHYVYSLDVPGVAFYQEMQDALRLEMQFNCLIQPQTPLRLPASLKFDLITAFHLKFDFKNSADLYPVKLEDTWCVADWDFFLTDLLTYMNPGGVIRFEILKKTQKIYALPSVLDYLKKAYNAHIVRNRITIEVK